MKNTEEKQQSICYDNGKSCEDCPNHNILMCKFDIKDTIIFAWPFLAVMALLVAGIWIGIKSTPLTFWGVIIFAVIYFGYLFFFFNFWESKILCSHCPFYVIDGGKTLKCYANYGFLKTAKYNPSPISKSEQWQFLIGAALIFLIPIIFLVIIKQNIISAISLGISIVWVIIIQNNGCKKCPNFSCILNRVPKERIDEYLKRNPQMREAWEKAGYQISD